MNSGNFNDVGFVNYIEQINDKEGKLKLIKFSFGIGTPKKVEDGYETSYENFRGKAWGHTAKYIANNIDNGDKVFLSGNLRSSVYEKDGQKRNDTYINVVRVECMKKITVEVPWNDDSRSAARG